MNRGEPEHCVPVSTPGSTGTLPRHIALVRTGFDTGVNWDDKHNDAGTVWTRLTASCRFTAVSSGCLTVQSQIMPEELC